MWFVFVVLAFLFGLCMVPPPVMSIQQQTMFFLLAMASLITAGIVAVRSKK